MKKKVTVILIAAVFVVLVALIGLLTGGTTSLTPFTKTADLTDYFGEGQPAEDEARLVVNGQVLEDTAWQADGEWYMDIDTAAQYLGSRMYADQDENVAVFTLPTSICLFTPDEASYTMDGTEVDTDTPVVVTKGDTWGVELSFLIEYTDFSYAELEDPERLVILADWDNLQVASAEGKMLVSADKKAEMIEKLDGNEEVYVIGYDDTGDWVNITTPDGYAGFLSADAVTVKGAYSDSHESHEPEYTSISLDETICMAWHQVMSQSANSTLSERIANASSLNVISPTWFTIADEQGNLTSLASYDYVAQAHDAGLQVWILLDNFTTDVDTLKILSSTAARTNLIDQVVKETQAVDADGINLDFESITEAQAPHYIEFMRELSVACRNAGLVFSVDDPVPAFSSYYQRDEQGILADYVIIMGYDEHYAGSTEAGSVASLTYVEQGIQDTLEEVPADKVINAMPFYTRLWTQTYDTGSLDSQVMGMAEAEQYAKDHNMTTYWDADTAQNIAELDSGNTLQTMWLEDAKSLKAKMELIDSYDLAGGAFWKLGLEDASIWDTINKQLGD